MRYMSLWQLHREAMDGAVLSDDGAGIEGDNGAVGEGSGDDAQGLGIFLGLGISGNKHCTVENQEVGISRRQALAFIQNCRSHRQFQQAIGPSVGGAKRAELLLKCLKISEVRIAGVVAAHVEERVVGCAAHDGVDVAVGVVADEVAVVEPHDALSTEPAFQFGFKLLATQRLVTIRSQQALRGGENGAAAVALDAAALQNEILMAFELKVES